MADAMAWTDGENVRKHVQPTRSVPQGLQDAVELVSAAVKHLKLLRGELDLCFCTLLRLPKSNLAQRITRDHTFVSCCRQQQHCPNFPLPHNSMACQQELCFFLDGILHNPTFHHLTLQVLQRDTHRCCPYLGQFASLPFSAACLGAPWLQ